MAQLNITADELKVAKQRIQNKYAKIELLNSDFQVIDSLEGVAINGSISVDATSDMRRSATLKMLVQDSSFEVSPDGKIWLDKYVVLYLGTELIPSGEIIYTKIGTFILDAPSYEYDAVNKSIQVSLLDLMAKLSGLRNGYMPGVPIIVYAGENMREAMIDTLALGGFTKYVCSEGPGDGLMPIDLNLSQGSTIYSVLSGIRDIYPNYEIFFDVDGVFHYQPIPTGDDEPIQIDDTLWPSIVISEKDDVDFQNVKNYIEVWGRTHEPAYFSSSTTVHGTLITLTMADVAAYTEDMIYGFTLTDNTGITAPTLRIGSLTTLPVMIDESTPATIEAESGEIYYCVQYIGGDSPYFLWIGHLQAYAEVKDENPESPFYVNGSIGEIRLPLYGGDYDNCLTDDLAYQRAMYELYMHTNINDSLTLSCVPIPWLDVNTLVEYTLQRNGETRQYLIKSFSYGFDIDDTMSITMVRYYPEYSGL